MNISRKVVFVAIFTSLTAVLAQITLYLPFTPIPITLQTLGVVLSGILGGVLLGFLSQIMYLALIAMGLPIVAGLKGGVVVLLGPTAGFLYGFPIAAAISGLIAGKIGNKSRKQLLLASLIGVFSVYPTGLLWLNLVYGVKENLLNVSVLPFIPGDVVKAFIASEIAYRITRIRLK